MREVDWPYHRPPQSEPEAPLAAMFVVANWRDACAAPARRLSATAIAYRDAWCSEPSLRRIRIARLMGIGDPQIRRAARADAIVLAANELDPAAAMAWLARAGASDGDALDRLASAYAFAGDVTAARQVSDAIDTIDARRADLAVVRCARTMRALEWFPERRYQLAERAQAIAAEPCTSYRRHWRCPLVAYGARWSTCAGDSCEVDRMDQDLAPCEAWLVEHGDGDAVRRAWLLAAWVHWPTHGDAAAWLRYAWRALRVVPEPAAAELVVGAIRNAARVIWTAPTPRSRQGELAAGWQ